MANEKDNSTKQANDETSKGTATNGKETAANGKEASANGKETSVNNKETSANSKATDSSAKLDKNSMKEKIPVAIQDSEESSTDSDEKILLAAISRKEEAYSIWSLDEWLHSSMEEWNPIFPYLIEILVVFTVLLLPSISWLIKSWMTLNLSKYFSNPGPVVPTPEGLFRIALFTFIWYMFDIAISILTEAILIISYLILWTLQLDESEFCWCIIDVVYTSRGYLRISLDCLLVFLLSIKMFSKYNRPTNFNLLQHNVQITLILWVGIYCGMIFLMKVIVNVLVYDVKNGSFKKQIRDLNQKLFIFRKLQSISEAGSAAEADELADTMAPSYDPGLQPRERDLFDSPSEAKLVTHRLMARLKKKHLTYKDIERYFPHEGELVFQYLAGTETVEKDKVIKRKALKAIAAELSIKRKHMMSTLRDRDTIFEKLELIFWIITTYLSAIILCILFDINYALYLFGIGTSLLTFSWIFADTIKMLFNCFVFVLILRPYAIGDRVIIQNEEYGVSKIDLLTTTFINKTNTITYMQNIGLMMSTTIHNISRSPPQNLLVEVKVGDTKYTDLKKAESKLNSEVRKIARHFQGAELLQLAEGKALFSITMVQNAANTMLMRTRKDKLAKILEPLFQKSGIPSENSYLFKI